MATTTRDALAAELAAVRAERDQARARWRSLLQASQAVVSSLSLDEVLAQVMAGLRDLLGVSAATAWARQPDGSLRRLAASGLSAEYLARVEALPADQGVTASVIRTGQPQAVPDIEREPRLQTRDLLRAEGLRSLLSAPLLSHGQPKGALTVYRRDVHEFSADEVDLLASFANQAAAAIEHAQLHGETRRILDEVSAQKDMLDRVVQNAEDGIVLIDRDWRVVLFSPGAERLTGWTAEEVVGSHCHEFLRCRHVGEAPLCEVACPLVPLFDQTMPPYMELLINRRDGSERWLGASWAPIHNEQGQTTGGVMILRDITAAKQLDQMKTALISTVSHELRTPLTSIRALSELLADHEFSAEEGQDLACTISREAVRLTRLVDNILDAARLEQRRLPREGEAVEVRQVVAEAVAALGGQAPHHQFLVEIPDGLPKARIDSDRLRQILDNLLSNAVKYAPAGGPITIRAGREGGQVWVSVHDQGIGIADEHLPHVFDRFYRIETEDARSEGGVGLGLYIVRSLVQLYGGDVCVESRPGAGATFTFSVPVAEAVEPAEGLPLSAKPGQRRVTWLREAPKPSRR